ncbi:MAG: hypothetical protein QNJ51_11365 [Calothrix sp. MO_167.B12]|nr:hypothetical protein [Calothrix sp. MO_167.B12]
MNNEQQEILDIYLQEYNKLKDEQIQRIGFRDNLIYVTLGVFGGVLAFALGEKLNADALLVLPWVSLVLGWTYLINDEKISAIGRYIRKKLVNKVNVVTAKAGVDIQEIEFIFGWEIEHRSDKRRKRRKIEQLIIDEITFVFSGIAALLGFWYLVPQSHWAVQILCWVELVLLIVLGFEIIVYADLKKGL